MSGWYLYEAAHDGTPLPVSTLDAWRTRGGPPYRRFDSAHCYPTRWQAEERGRALLSPLPPPATGDRADRLPNGRLRVGIRRHPRVPQRRPGTSWLVSVDCVTDAVDAALATARLLRQPYPDRCWLHYCRPVWLLPDAWTEALRAARDRGLLDLGRCDAPGAHDAATVAHAEHSLGLGAPVHYILLGDS